MKRDFLIFSLVSWPYFLNDIWRILLGNDPLGLLWSLDLIAFFVIFITIWYLIKNKSLSAQEIGLKSTVNVKSTAFAVVLCFFLLLAVELILSRWFYYWFPMGVLFTWYGFPETEPLRSTTMVYAALSSGVLEELIFRGILVSLLLRHTESIIIVMVFSVSIFGLIHWGEGPAKVLTVIAWAIIPTLWFIKSRNLWGVVSCHALYNFVIFSGYTKI